MALFSDDDYSEWVAAYRELIEHEQPCDPLQTKHPEPNTTTYYERIEREHPQTAHGPRNDGFRRRRTQRTARAGE